MSREFVRLIGPLSREARPIEPGVLTGTIYSSPEAMSDALKAYGALGDELGACPAVVIEGPPLYLGQTHPELPSDCRFDSAAMIRGWDITNAFAHEIVQGYPDTRLFSDVLIDDLNFSPPDGFTREDLSGFNRFRRARDGILRKSSGVHLESSFMLDPADQCAAMDARFQLGKRGRYGLDVMSIIVHPESFRAQQRAMLAKSLREMKHGTIFGQMTRGGRRDLLADRTRHIWVNSNGQLTGVTRPVFDGNQFQHESML